MCVKESKNKTIEGEKIFEHDVFDKGLISRKYKESLQINNKKTNKPIKKNWKHFWIYIYPNVQMVNKHMKNAQVTKEMYIKTTMKYHFTFMGMTIIKNKVMIVGEDLKKLEPSYTSSGIVRCCSYFEKLWLSVSQKAKHKLL